MIAINPDRTDTLNEVLTTSQYRVQYVDVNVQNPQAAGFYRHIGFELHEYTELDEQGNPFPIIKMKIRL